MISKMIRYDIVLHVGEQENFINQLREVGLVDITTTGWEPSDADRKCLAKIDAYNKAIEQLEAFKASECFVADVEPYASGEEAFDAYTKTQERRAELLSKIAQLEKQAADIEPWGSFSSKDIERLSDGGVVLRFFTAQHATFAALQEQADEGITLVEIGQTQAQVYFAVVAAKDATIAVDGQEVHLPDADYKETLKLIAEHNAANAELDKSFSRAAASLSAIEDRAAELKEQLQGLQVSAMAQREADGQLLVMEGWAEADTAERVDALLKQQPNLIYLRRDANIDDEAPVKLKNNKFASLFELIGSMYALPKYGTFDLTAIFGPFYMLFFAICL